LARRRRIHIVIESASYSEGDTLAFGESQVRIAAAAETCFGLDTLLLQSLIGGARARTEVVPGLVEL
jgi:hypothetical protein